MDKIFLNQMRFYGYHGVYEEENRLGQHFVVDTELMCDLIKEAARTDDINKAVDYAKVYEAVRKEVEGTQVNLLETLADRIAASLLTKFPVYQVKVRVTKPNPPIPGDYQSVGIEVVRDQETK